MLHPIPASVTLDDLNAALEPLCALLGITPNHVYDIPGIHIGHERVTFVVPAVATDGEWQAETPRAPRAASPQVDDLANELALVISVAVER